MTRDELIEKIARAICCPSGCNFARQCDATNDLAQERQREASAALDVVTEWLKREAKTHCDAYAAQGYRVTAIREDECRRLIAITKGDEK